MKSKTEGRPVEILLVEDNHGDATLMREMLKLSRFPIHLNLARNGEDAMRFLRGEEPFSYALKPDLILLDLNLPKKDGREVLKEIKQIPEWRDIPVLILTASVKEADRREAYESEANFYLMKPMRLEQFSVMLKYLEDFWIKTLVPLA